MFNITGVNIEISDTADLSSISEMRLVDLYCKHMIKVNFLIKRQSLIDCLELRERLVMIIVNGVLIPVIGIMYPTTWIS